MAINVEGSVVPTATSGANSPSTADGPKYNDDANLLDETSEESDAAASEETIDDEGNPIVAKPTKEEDAEDTEDEDKEESDTEEESDKEKPQIPFDRPSISEIRAKYPDFFKDFPALKESYFREIKFTQLFPTIEDAQEAFNDNEAFNTLSDSALSGDPAPLLDSIGKTDVKALETFSLSFLPTIFKKDSALYSTVITPVFQNLVQQMFRDKDENTQNAALVLADWIFGEDGKDVAQGKKSVAKSIIPSDEQKRLKEQKEQQSSASFRTSVGHVEQTVEQGLISLIFKSPAFDPDKVFSPSLRRMGAQEIIKKINAQMQSDQGHMTVMAARWKRARANGYTAAEESKIVSAYLARAKSLIPENASKVSAAMLGTKKAAATVKGARTLPAPKQNNSGRSGSERNGRSQLDYSKMSDLDILNN